MSSLNIPFPYVIVRSTSKFRIFEHFYHRDTTASKKWLVKSLREEECLFFKSRNISEGESGRVGYFLARLLRLRLSQSARNAFCRMPSYYYADHCACSHIFRAGPFFRGGRKTADQVNIANRCIVASGNSISRPNDPT